MAGGRETRVEAARTAFGTCAGSRESRLEATIEGNVIRSYINGVEVLSVTDDAVATGSPGVGFNFFVGNTNVDHGFSSFEVDTYE